MSFLNGGKDHRRFNLNLYPQGAASDPFFASVLLLMHMDGVNNGTVFTDSSSNNRAFSGVGTAGHVLTSTTNPEFGTACGVNDGTVAAVETPSFNIVGGSTTEFTIECWFRTTVDTTNMRMFSVGSAFNVANGFAFRISGTGAGRQVQTIIGSGGSQLASLNYVGGTGLIDGNWHWMVWQHNNTTGDAFLAVDGIKRFIARTGVNPELALTSPTTGTAFDLMAGRNAPADALMEPWNGALDELRITQVARYAYGGTVNVSTIPMQTAPWPNQ